MDGGNNEVISFIVVSVIFFAVEQVAERELVKISLPPPISGRNVVIDVFFIERSVSHRWFFKRSVIDDSKRLDSEFQINVDSTG